MDEPTNHLDIKSKKCLESSLTKNMKEPFLVSHDRDFLQGMSNLVYEFRDQKIKEYLGDVNYLEQRNLENMREVEKKDALKAGLKDSNKASYEEQKGESIAESFKVESQIKQLEKDIQHDDKMLASNYNKILKTF
jgi:ATP-binding cassette subfamily F protein 3